MKDEDFAVLAARLREAGATWFNDGRLRDLESLVAEAVSGRVAAAAALRLENRIYHNASAHDAPKDWAEVKIILKAVLS